MSQDLKELEDKLNRWFEKGYHISGGIAIDGKWYVAVVVKPF
uniref:Uncharacterized protein n=1 Tax=Salmonella phage vB_SEnST11_KE23 TaxID=3161174 RepID=A0AAU8GEU5_9CAUD